MKTKFETNQLFVVCDLCSPADFLFDVYTDLNEAIDETIRRCIKWPDSEEHTYVCIPLSVYLWALTSDRNLLNAYNDYHKD